MDAPETEISPDAATLAMAFPATMRTEALVAGEAVTGQLGKTWPTEFFPVLVEQQTVRIPDRLYLRLRAREADLGEPARLMARCLQARSHDGYQRQRAARDVMADLRPWSAPFVVDLIGSYVVEILSDIHAALSAEKVATIAPFLAANLDYWQCIRARVMRYWDVYYRDTSRSDYLGFALVDLLDQSLGANTAALPPMRGRRVRRALARSRRAWL